MKQKEVKNYERAFLLGEPFPTLGWYRQYRDDSGSIVHEFKCPYMWRGHLQWSKSTVYRGFKNLVLLEDYKLGMLQNGLEAYSYNSTISFAKEAVVGKYVGTLESCNREINNTEYTVVSREPSKGYYLVKKKRVTPKFNQCKFLSVEQLDSVQFDEVVRLYEPEMFIFRKQKLHFLKEIGDPVISFNREIVGYKTEQQLYWILKQEVGYSRHQPPENCASNKFEDSKSWGFSEFECAKNDRVYGYLRNTDYTVKGTIRLKDDAKREINDALLSLEDYAKSINAEVW